MFIDLTRTLSAKTPSYTKAEAIHIDTFTDQAITITTLKTSMHNGTHIDVPYHMIPNKPKVDTYPIDDFIQDAIILDATNQERIDLTHKSHLIKPRTAVLIKTNTKELINYPVISEAFIKVLIDKQITILGLDTPSPDKAPYLIHKTCFNHNIKIVENLTNLDACPLETYVTFYAIPIKIAAEAALIRAFIKQ